MFALLNELLPHYRLTEYQATALRTAIIRAYYFEARVSEPIRWSFELNLGLAIFGSTKTFSSYDKIYNIVDIIFDNSIEYIENGVLPYCMTNPLSGIIDENFPEINYLHECIILDYIYHNDKFNQRDFIKYIVYNNFINKFDIYLLSKFVENKLPHIRSMNPSEYPDYYSLNLPPWIIAVAQYDRPLAFELFDMVCSMYRLYSDRIKKDKSGVKNKIISYIKNNFIDHSNEIVEVVALTATSEFIDTIKIIDDPLIRKKLLSW